MHLPIIKKQNRYKKSIISFGGLNLTQDYSIGEMSQCSGVSHMNFPAITQRQKSENVFSCKNPTAIVFADKECIAAEDGLYYDGKKVSELSAGKKQLVALGSKIAVFPDKIYYDIKTDEVKSLAGKCKTHGATVTFTKNSISVPDALYKETLKSEETEFRKEAQLITYNTATVSDGKITLGEFALKNTAELSEGTILYEKCKKNEYRIVESVLFCDDGTCIVKNTLVTVENVLQDIFSSFEAGDVVEISGCVQRNHNNIKATIVSKTNTSLTFADETFTEGSETEEIVIERKIPDFTCVCSYENRLWGCEGNTIYASALGDFRNFFTYNHLSTDSFTVTSNSAGDFTACIPFGNSCFFFKENSCYKLYGNRPANFQLTETFGTGILQKDAMSMVNAGGKLIYKGNGGIYVFYGSTSQRISDKLGVLDMENAVSGSNGKLYYISADTEGGREEFVWDIERNLWSKSGVCDVLGYSSYGNDIYRLKPDGVEKICEEADPSAQWSITFCPFDEGYYKTKNYSRLHIRAELFEGAYIRTEIKGDDGSWRVIDTSYGDRKRYLNIPCNIKSCHEVQLRLSGKGKSIVEEIVREFSAN